MEKSLGPSNLSVFNNSNLEKLESFTCDACGEEFDQPLFAAVSSNTTHDEYYACPRCLSKIECRERKKNVEADETKETEQLDQTQDTQNKPQEVKTEESTNCKYQFGYLNKSQKNTPIPEECLICTKMIECRSH
jgi:DNA-directed RNA polymerase subunit RPC12/RpoP